jgi:hypothetical protein
MRLVRRQPIKFTDGVERLASESGLDRGTCENKLRECLAAGNELRDANGEPIFAFRLHQFLAAGRTVYATLESQNRHLTLEAQHYAPGVEGERLLYPLVFCRECGQEYYMVMWGGGETGTVGPRLLSSPRKKMMTGINSAAVIWRWRKMRFGRRNTKMNYQTIGIKARPDASG